MGAEDQLHRGLQANATAQDRLKETAVEAG